MRSSKSRSRSKSNRPRSIGNIINRVFDSSGPEGKVRGTPAQIIEKYLFLARDAQLSNDRVAAENFLQHAEHYTRLLGEAQRELAAEQENRRAEHQPGGNGQPQNHRQDRPREDRSEQPRFDQPRGDQPRAEQPRPDREPPSADDRTSAHQVIDLDDRSDDDAGLVETPESAQRHRPAPRRRPEPSAEAAPDAPEAAAEPAPTERPRRPRGPRKPKPRGEGDNPDGNGPREAAE